MNDKAHAGKEFPGFLGKSCKSVEQLNSFQVFGERRSGTNFVEALLQQNLHLNRVRRYGWKHGLVTYPVLPVCCLFVVVIRHPVDWVRGFYRAPYEVEKTIARLPFSQFIRHEVESVFHLNSAGWRQWGYGPGIEDGDGGVLQFDRHPITGRRFTNVFEMRKIKLAGHISFLRRGGNALVVRYEDVIASPEGFLRLVAETWKLQIRGDEAHNVENYVGMPHMRPGSSVDKIDPEDYAFIKENVDLEQEKRCGYIL